MAFIIGQNNVCQFKGLLLTGPKQNPQYDLYIRPGTRYYAVAESATATASVMETLPLSSNQCTESCDNSTNCIGISTVSSTVGNCTLLFGVISLEASTSSNVYTAILPREYVPYVGPINGGGTLQVFYIGSDKSSRCSAICDGLRGKNDYHIQLGIVK